MGGMVIFFAEPTQALPTLCCLCCFIMIEGIASPFHKRTHACYPADTCVRTGLGSRVVLFSHTTNPRSAWFCGTSYGLKDLHRIYLRSLRSLTPIMLWRP